MGRLSIKQKLRKARTKGKAVSVILDWSDNYKTQITRLIEEMGKAKDHGDLRTLGYLARQLILHPLLPLPERS